MLTLIIHQEVNVGAAEDRNHEFPNIDTALVEDEFVWGSSSTFVLLWRRDAGKPISSLSLSWIY